jgi:hypothetical protein
MGLINFTKKQIIAEAQRLNNAANAAITASEEKAAQYETLKSATSQLKADLENQKKEILELKATTQTSLAELTNKSISFSNAANGKLADVDLKISTITTDASKKVTNFIESDIKPKAKEAIELATVTKDTTLTLKGEVDAVVEKVKAIHNGTSQKHDEVTSKHDNIAKLLTKAEQITSEICGDDEGMCATGPSIRRRSETVCKEAEQALVDGEALKKQAESLLNKMTDASLHTAFSKSAHRYMIGSWVILIIQVIVLGIAAFLAYRAIDLEVEDLLKNILPTIPLGFLVYFLNRAYTVEKKLAEEYQHKSSLTKTLAGYRALYKLSHEDKEYMALFTHIKEGITRNPSKEINPLLFRRLPIDTLTDTAEKAIDTAQKSAEKAVSAASASVAKSADAMKSVANATEAAVEKIPDKV